jgi:hypothetical protein
MHHTISLQKSDTKIKVVLFKDFKWLKNFYQVHMMENHISVLKEAMVVCLFRSNLLLKVRPWIHVEKLINFIFFIIS